MNPIEVTVDQLIKCSEEIRRARKEVVANISYANQISHEDDSQYRDHLNEIDLSYMKILKKIDNMVVVN